jgi:hypothetical protein
MIRWARGSVIWSKRESGEWSERDELVLGRCLNSGVLVFKMKMKARVSVTSKAGAIGKVVDLD